MLLLHKVNCVLPVDLYDTTGDADLHINEEVVKAVALVSDQKCKEIMGVHAHDVIKH